jgi:hypothetical protein
LNGNDCLEQIAHPGLALHSGSGDRTRERIPVGRETRGVQSEGLQGSGWT